MGTQLLIAAKPGFTTISPDRSRVAAFDREGRLYSYFKDGITYRRTLASIVEVRWRDQGRQRSRLQPDQARDLFAETHALVLDAYPDIPTTWRGRIKDEILPWTPERLMAEADAFSQIYKPIPILPPDQYLSIVLQATEGCTWNKCTFCSFYQDRPFRAKSNEEFVHHTRGVRDFLGRGALMRKGLFLADGNALALSQSRLEGLLHTARGIFPDRQIYSFIDLYTGERRSIDGWKSLAELGLHRVYIGMETGLDELLQLLNKPGSGAELVQFVRDLKEAGLAVGLIVMVGVGGRQYKEAHRKATLDLIERMPLTAGDLMYLSPFIEHADSEYAQRRGDGSLTPITPMTEEEIYEELDVMAQHIRTLGIKAARYDIRESLY